MGTVRGANHPKTKLTEAQARELKRRALLGEPYAVLVEEYKVSPATISAIAHGKAWTHIVIPDAPAVRPQCKGSRHWLAKMTEDTVREAWKLKRQGWTGHAIAERFGVSDTAISQIFTRKLWKHVREEP